MCEKDKLLGHTAAVMSFDNESQLEKIGDRYCKPETAMVTHSYTPCTREKCQCSKPGSRETGIQNKQEAPITEVPCPMKVLVQITDPACSVYVNTQKQPCVEVDELCLQWNT